MKKLIFLFTFFLLNVGILNATSTFSKNIAIQVDVLDVNKAILSITYTTPSKNSIMVLPTKKLGPLLDSGRTLRHAYGNDNTPRSIQREEGKDSVVSVKKGDKTITVVYELNNLLSHENVGMFNFPVILGGAFPKSALISVTSSNSDIEIFYYPKIGIGQNKNQITFVSNKKPSELYIEDLTIVTLRKDKYSAFSRQDFQGFSIVAAKNKLDRVVNAFKNVYQNLSSLEMVFGISRPQKIIVLAVPFKNFVINDFYEASGLALSSDLILIDSDSYKSFSNTLDMQKIFAHEVAHLFLEKANLFNGDSSNVKWINEGLSVFAEQFLTDNFLIKNINTQDRVTATSDYKKLSRAELSSVYKNNFDYDFLINTKTQPIIQTYKHSGLIFYNLFVQNQNSVKRIIEALQKENPSRSCIQCDRKTAERIISKISGLSIEDVIYPYKKNISAIPPLIEKSILSP